MATTETATEAVVTSPSFVIVADAAAFMPKFFLGLTVFMIGTLVFVSLMVFMSAMLPRLREVTAAKINTHPWWTFGMGLIGFAVLGSLSAFTISNASVEYLLRTEYKPGLLGAGIAICAFQVLMTFIGGIGLVQAIGDNLERLNGQDMSGLRKTFWGSLILVGACVFPAIGWFIILPASLLFAFGAAIWTLLPRR